MSLLTAHDARLVDGDLPGFTSFVTGAEATAQRVWVRLSIHKGEWFQNPNAGLPWSDWMSRSMTPGLQAAIENAVREQVRTIPGVRAVLSVKSTWDAADADLAIRIEAALEDQVLEIEFAVSNARYGNRNIRIVQRLTNLSAIVS